METIPKIVVVLAGSRIIRDRDISYRKINVNVLASHYSIALTGMSTHGWSKLRWLYINRHKHDLSLRWMVLDENYSSIIAVNRDQNRGSVGPDWAVLALEEVAFPNRGRQTGLAPKQLQ
jgi:hypothetical protein